MAGKTLPITDRRDPLTKAKGMGSAKSGVEHWLEQQITAFALIPLALFAAFSFLYQVVLTGEADSARAYVQNPFFALVLALVLLVGIRHGSNGVAGIVEDYVHHRVARILTLVAIKFLAVLTSLIGLVAILKILFGA